MGKFLSIRPGDPVKPIPPLTIVGFKQTGSASAVGVSATIILKDAEGKHFTGSFAYFVNELSVYNPIQDMSFNEWCRLRAIAADKHPRRWSMRDENIDARKLKYLEGVAPDKFEE